MMERHLQHREPDPNPRRAHRQRRREQQRIIIDAFPGEIMLGQPNIVEAQRLGCTDLRNLFVDSDGILVRGW